jgi:MYXO-CTERM domain-containing protein
MRTFALLSGGLVVRRLAAQSAVLGLLLFLAPAAARAQQVKPRFVVLVDTSGSMTLTPEIFSLGTTSLTCSNTPASCTLGGICGAGCGAGRPPCPSGTTCKMGTCQCGPGTTCSGNRCSTCSGGLSCRPTGQGPTGAQCICPGGTECDGNNCQITDGLSTHGDGSAEHRGCDMDGDVKYDDSRIYAAKSALSNVVRAFGEVEFALARFKQLYSQNKACSTYFDCPRGPGNTYLFDCVGGRCKVCIGNCDAPTNYDECTSTFSCDSGSMSCPVADRDSCLLWAVDQTCQGDLSPINGASIACASPSNDDTCINYIGAYRTASSGASCENSGGEVLVDFPATSLDDNYTQIESWINHQETNTTTDLELRGIGPTPLGDSLTDMRTFLTSKVTSPLKVDTSTPCRDYAVVLLTDGEETCAGDPVAAAQALRNLSITRNDGITVTVDVKTYVIALAVCPASNPSCPTQLQLNDIAKAGGTGAAYAVASETEIGAAMADIVARSIKTESCNGLDDNCNKQIDEDFPEKGQACSVGKGVCLRAGTRICKTDGSGTECTAVAGTGSAEKCNGLDDDCNGLIDDGISCTPCTPQTEVCNGRDDDCDGVADDGIMTGICGTDVGACTFGVTSCQSGVLICTPGVGPKAEACNNVDDDCDGITDAFSKPCYEFVGGCDLVSATCMGACTLGQSTCTAGKFGECLGDRGPTAEIACNLIDDDCDGKVDEDLATEVCDGKDNDCDGFIDESDPSMGKTCGTPPFVGYCQAGVLVCVGGALVCQGERDPQAEICDNVDNDCNGAVDDNVPGFGGACGIDTGECVAGRLRCTAGVATCVDAVGPTAELCDCKDNDCDGQADEADPLLGSTCGDLPSGGTVTTEVGECQLGVRACSKTTCGLTCVGALGPTDELCNGKDDDCDGLIDEDFAGVGKICDNGMRGACFFAGVTVCTADGKGTICTAQMGTPTTEICNAVDDDCDGAIDEEPMPTVGTECSPAIGSCTPGIWLCTRGMLECSSGSMGSAEVCNGQDDDCDGFIDEPVLPGTGAECTDPMFEKYGDVGECEFGLTTCENAKIVCGGYVGPKDEVCNGKDDDCDGVPDNMAQCPNAEEVCYEGSCVKPCCWPDEYPCEFGCFGGFACIEIQDTPAPMHYCVEDPCLSITCPDDAYCDPQIKDCVSWCTPDTCKKGQTCIGLGECIDCFDRRLPCAAGSLCVANADGVGECQDDPCMPNPCKDGEVCRNGLCIGSCEPECPAGSRCDTSSGKPVCVEDLCFMKECPTPEHCDPATGDCVKGHCEAVVCPPGQLCVEATGDCTMDPCLGTTCPKEPPQHCEVTYTGEAHCVETAIEKIVAGGSGSISCRVSAGRGQGPGTTPWFLLAGALALWLRRPRPERRQGGRR